MNKKVFRAVFIFLLFAPACMPPSEEDIAIAIEQTSIAGSTNTPQATSTPTPQEIEMVCPIEILQHQDWDTVFCETFDDNSYQWDVGVDNELGMESKIANGKYSIDYNSSNATGYTTGFTVSTPFWESKEFVVEISAEMDSPYTQCTWGLMVNGGFDTGVSFEIDNTGNYFISDSLIPDNYVGNAKYGSNNAIKWEDNNTITIIVEDQELTAFVNGKLINSYEYSSSNDDLISLVVWGAEGVSTKYTIDYIVVKEKPSSNIGS